MLTLRQTDCLQKAISLLATVLILAQSAVAQSAEPSDNIHLTPPMHTTDLPGPTMTTAIVNGSMEEPRVLRMQKPCKEEDATYCVNGQCMYPPDSDTPACMCEPSYGGSRCMFFHQPSLTVSSHEEIIGISVGVCLLVCCLAILLYCCLRRRCDKPSPPYKTYGSENSV